MKLSEKMSSCPVCSAPVALWKKKEVDGTIFTIDRCVSCDFAFVNPKPTFEFLMDYYAAGSGDPQVGEGVEDVLRGEAEYPNSTLDAGRLVRTIQTLSGPAAGKKFLDVGCGYGFFSREAVRAGFDVSAIELSENGRRIAAELAGVRPAPYSFEEYVREPGSLSAILMSQILEHVLDINAWIQKAHDLLAIGGVLAVALPNFASLFRVVMQENEPYICPPQHLNFFSKKSLSKLLEKHGFKVEDVQWVSRIPARSLVARVPFVPQSLFPVFELASGLSLKTIDALHLGAIVNVYARKL